MIDDTIRKIESKLDAVDSVNPDKRQEIKSLLAELKQEVESLSHTDQDHAYTIAGFTEVFTHEATRNQKHPQSFQHALDGLKSSVKGFEESHPALVNAVDRICRVLSNFGI